MLATPREGGGLLLRTARVLQRQLSKRPGDALQGSEQGFGSSRIHHLAAPGLARGNLNQRLDAPGLDTPARPRDWLPLIGSTNGVQPSGTVVAQQVASLWNMAPLIGQSGKAERYSSNAAPSSQVAAIKQLRERTGAPMKDVKGVLVACDWDMEAAFTELRKKGLAAANKKKARVAADGLLGLAQTELKVAVVEINSETDFVARNGIFQHLVQRVAQAAVHVVPLEGSPSPASATPISLADLEDTQISLDHPQLQGTRLVREALAEVSAITGENIHLRRGFHLAEPSGVVGTYLHMGPQPGLARMVGLVGLQVQGGQPDRQELQTLADQLALHVVAIRPLYLRRDLVPAEVLAKEREILATQAAGSGKPAAVVEKMVEGRLRKFYEDMVLLEQPYMLEEKQKVQAVVNEASKKWGSKLEVVAMHRLEVGEGVEKVEKDFATEVREQVSQGA